MLKNIPVLTINQTDCTIFILFDRNYQKYIVVDKLHNWTFDDIKEMNNLDIYYETNCTISLDIYDYLPINEENFQYIDYDFLFSNKDNNAVRKIRQISSFDTTNEVNEAKQTEIITEFLSFLL